MLSVYVLYNLVYIELNVIDLVWDIVVRFFGVSEEFD